MKKNILLFLGLWVLEAHAALRVDTIAGQSDEDVYMQTREPLYQRLLGQDGGYDDHKEENIYATVGPALPARNVSSGASRESLNDSGVSGSQDSLRTTPAVARSQSVGSSSGFMSGLRKLFSGSSIAPAQPKPALVIGLATKQLADFNRTIKYVKSSAEDFYTQVATLENADASTYASFLEKYGPLVQQARIVETAAQGPLALTRIIDTLRYDPALGKQLQAIGELQVVDLSRALDKEVQFTLATVPQRKTLAALKPSQLRLVFRALEESKEFTINRSDTVIRSITSPDVAYIMKSLHDLLLCQNPECQKAAFMILQGKTVTLDKETQAFVDNYLTGPDEKIVQGRPTIENVIAIYNSIFGDVSAA